MVSEPVTSMASTPPSTSPLPALTLPNLNQVHHFLTLKLSPTNYLLWKTQFLPLLRSFDLMGLIDGTDVKPPAALPSVAGQSASSPNPDYASWTRRDQLLLSWIIASLSEEVLPQVVGINSSFEVWNTLHQAFGAPSHTRILQLTMQLQHLKKGDTDISSYLRQAKYLADELTVAGQPISPANFNAIIFNNLGSDYAVMISTLATRVEPVSYPELHSLLVSHEIRLTHQHVALPPLANLTINASPPPFLATLLNSLSAATILDRCCSFSRTWSWSCTN